MPRPTAPINLLDALNTAPSDRREKAAKALLDRVVGIQAKRGGAQDAESIAHSAVVEVLQRAHDQPRMFQSSGELINYLKEVLRGKSGKRNRRAKKESGSLLNVDNPGSTSDSRPRNRHPVHQRRDTTSVREGSFVDHKISITRAYPEAFRPWLADFAARKQLHGGLQGEALRRVVEAEAASVMDLFNTVVQEFPKEYQEQAARHFRQLGVDIATELRDTKARLEVARKLRKKEHLMIIQMLASGMKAADVARQLGKTQDAVRQIECRNNKKASIHLAAARQAAR